ncbi:YqhV family protein [Viridibacillus sp. FSL R5-0477]|nr:MULTISPECIES: YqhV family protein [Viridibacillus]
MKNKVVIFIEKALLLIILLRLCSGSIEVTAALFMIKYNDLEKAFYINTLLALVGPTVLIVTTGIGLAGLAEKVSILKMVCLFSGIFLILFSLNSK